MRNLTKCASEKHRKITDVHQVLVPKVLKMLISLKTWPQKMRVRPMVLLVHQLKKSFGEWMREIGHKRIVAGRETDLQKRGEVACLKNVAKN